MKHRVSQKKTTITTLSNPLNSEVWYCRDYNDTKNIDGVNYITVFKPENDKRTFLMRKDALKVLSRA